MSKRLLRRIRNRFAPGIGQRIFFLHMPKCGGTSIVRAIRTGYRLPEDRFIRVLYARARDVAELLGQDPNEYLTGLLLYFMSLDKIKFISGHVSFSETTYREFASQWRYVTMLRHPVARWFSHFFYDKYKTRGDRKIADDLETFVGSERGLANGRMYVQFLTGGGPVPGDEVSAAVTSAIAALDKFALVGCLEHRDDFINRFAQQFGVTLTIEKHRVNPLPQQAQRRYITDGIRTQVEDICKPDLAVYNHALEQIERR